VVTEAEAQDCRARKQQARDELRSRAPIIASGTPGSYTFAIGTDERARAKTDARRYEAPKGGTISITFTAIDDAGAPRSGLNREIDVQIPAGGLANAPRLVRLSFVAGVATKVIDAPDSGVFELRDGPNWRLDQPAVVKVWE